MRGTVLMTRTQQRAHRPRRQDPGGRGGLRAAGGAAGARASHRGGWWVLVLGAALPLGQAAAQEATHVVRGRVLDVATDAPVVGAQVFVLGIMRPAVTDSTGAFWHRRLAQASYLLQVRKSGYVAMTWEVMAVEDSSVIHLLKLQPLLEGLGNAPLPSGQAGSAVIRGRVIDGDTDAPVVGAEVSVLGRLAPATTDGTGSFRHPRLAPRPHVILVKKIGYEAATLELAATEDGTVEHVVALHRTDVPEMDTVVVTGTPAPPTSYWHPDFERRRIGGRGQFVTREEIEQRNAASLADLLRTLNGLRMVCRASGCAVQMTRTNCRPTYFADGFPADNTTVERMPVNDLFGVEVYDLFEVPVELQRSQLRCGVISIWTRRGPPPR